MKAKVALPTSAEITRRLRIVSELRNLCLSLGRARRLGGDNTAGKQLTRSMGCEVQEH